MDEFEGQGGSYLLDEATGKRTLIERTQEKAVVETAGNVQNTDAESDNLNNGSV